MNEKLKKSQEIVVKQQEEEIKRMKNVMLSGEKIVALGLVANMLDAEKQVQPAGVDFTLKRLSSLESAGVIDFDNSQRKLPDYEEISFGEDDKLHLESGAYLVEFNETVTMPLNMLGLMRTRSSVFRSGATLTAGVIDPGYSGAVGALLQVWNENGIDLTKNAKLSQWVFAEVEEASKEGYIGVYSGAESMF